MKTKSKIALFALFCLANTASFAQAKTEKKEIFASYANNIVLSEKTLMNTFSAKAGEAVVINFSADFVYSGTVVSNLTKYDNLQSLIIKSPAFENALLQLSKTVNADKSISFSGRIISPNAADGYEIKKDNNEQYHFQKIQTGKILQDCSFN